MLGVRDGFDGSVKSRRRSRDPKRRDERIFQQEVVYLRALLRGFGYPQRGGTEIWEDNASCIMMSETPTNRDRSRHVDVKVYFLRDLVRDGHIKLVKCAGTQNVSDSLTKSLPRLSCQNLFPPRTSLRFVQVDNFYHPHRGRVK